jgi:hypothetical protein
MPRPFSCGGRMPQAPNPMLPASDIISLRSWIAAGALQERPAARGSGGDERGAPKPRVTQVRPNGRALGANRPGGRVASPEAVNKVTVSVNQGDAPRVTKSVTLFTAAGRGRPPSGPGPVEGRKRRVSILARPSLLEASEAPSSPRALPQARRGSTRLTAHEDAWESRCIRSHAARPRCADPLTARCCTATGTTAATRPRGALLSRNSERRPRGVSVA